jgi:nucleoside 2-deoxyribosyltransferase
MFNNQILIIYLAGGIFELTKPKRQNWRNKATQKLNNKYAIIDPTKQLYTGKELEYRNEIIRNDKRNILKADILLVNATRPSWGTACEILFAYENHKIIIAYTNKPYERTSPWLAYHATIITKTLDEAIKLLFILNK